MTHRARPSQLLLVCLGQCILALEPTNGAIAWKFDAPFKMERVFRMGGRILACCGVLVVCIDIETGKALGQVDIGFVPKEGVVCGTDLVLAASNPQDGPFLACLTADGVLRWTGSASVVRDVRKTIRTQLPNGRVVSEGFVADSMYGEVALVFGDTVVQRDRGG
jgi:outer membrane protein assembly factor BamB